MNTVHLILSVFAWQKCLVSQILCVCVCVCVCVCYALTALLMCYDSRYCHIFLDFVYANLSSK